MKEKSKKANGEKETEVNTVVKKKRGRPKKVKKEGENTEVKKKKNEEKKKQNKGKKTENTELKEKKKKGGRKKENTVIEKKVTVMKYSELSEVEKEDNENKYKKVRKRIFNIMQYEKHPVTGQELLTEEKIIKALEEFGKCKYAYIMHDKDRNEDTTLKNRHFHIVIQTENPVPLIVVAKRFDILPNFVEVPKGRDAFGDCCEYLTHETPSEQEKGKYRYSDEEVKSNFNFRELVDNTVKRRFDRELRLVTGDDETYYFKGVHEGRLTLTDVLKENNRFYYKHERELKYFRNVYLQENAEMPKVRLNFYISGDGGAGKDSMCRALARALYPEETDDDKIFYMVGNDNVMFDGYDGQPVLIWSDFRAEELLKSFNYKKGVIFRIFDTHPQKFNLNIKYGKINLINKYNIVNSNQSWMEFLDGLVGEYVDKDGEMHYAEDKKQSYRRFPVLIPIRESDFDLLINKGFIGKGSYFEYNETKKIIGNFRRINEINDEEIRKKIERRTVNIPITEVQKIENKEEKEFDENEFLGYGSTEEQLFGAFSGSLEGDTEEKKEEFEEVKLLETEEGKKVKTITSEEEENDFPDLPVLDKKDKNESGEEGGGESGEDEFPF
jgi:hypothetical protein